MFVILQTFVFLSCDEENSNSSLFAQSANDAQRIIGTWKPEGVGPMFTFNANGTFSVSGEHGSNARQGNYLISNLKLLLRTSGSAEVGSIGDYYLSADGKFLVFSYIFHWPNGSRDTRTWWFIKQ